MVKKKIAAKKAARKKSTARTSRKTKRTATKKKAVRKTVVKKAAKKKRPPKYTTRNNRIRSKKFGIYVTDQKTGETIHLPVNPSDLSISRESDNTIQKVINLGEVNQLGLLKLTTLEVQSFFPRWKASYSDGKHYPPQHYIDILNKWQQNKSQVRVTVTSTEITFLMTISTFKHGFEKGNADDVTYNLTFTQYVPFDYSSVKKRKKPRGRSVTKKSRRKRSSKAKRITRGSSVIVTGQTYRNSTGGVKGKKIKKAKRTIKLVSLGKKYPYRIADGWVAKSSVKKA